MEVYDLIIIGAGPAGLTAAIYASRYLLNFIVIGKLFGGTMTEAHQVCNFPTQNNTSGSEITQKLMQHVKALGGKISQEEVQSINKEGDVFEIVTNERNYEARKVILATGRKRKELEVPGEERLSGKGVSYCAICDAPFFKDKVVAVVGGSNSALTSAILLAEHAKKVYIVYRQDKFFRAEPAWTTQVENNDKIETIFNADMAEIQGGEKVEKIKLNNDKLIDVDGVFVEVGFVPDETFPQQLGLKTDEGYIAVDKGQRTSVEGVYAAGDLTNHPLKQIITACSEGAVAAFSAYSDIKRGRRW